jgi:2TM domain
MKHINESGMKLGFNIHALVFVLTMVLLAAINLAKGEPYWVLWVLPGWGIGLFAHWWFVQGPGAKRAGTT